MNHFSKSRSLQQSIPGKSFWFDISTLSQGLLTSDDKLHQQVTREIMPLLANGQQLMRWIEGLPQETLDAHPRIGLLYIYALISTQQYEQALCCLKLARYALHCCKSSAKVSIETEIKALYTYLNMHQKLTSRYRETIHGLAHLIIPSKAEKDFSARHPLPDNHSVTKLDPLSQRELEVLNCIAAGLSNQEIAQKIVVTVGTVKRHINNIYNKLDVHSRIQAVRYAQTHHLISF